jgi:MFS family permease
LSDRIGRKRMYMTGAALTFVWAIPYFQLLDHGTAAVVAATIVVSLIPHNMQYGPQAALIAETFPTRLRYSGAGIGYQLASVIAGGPAPLIATWMLHTFNSSLPIALYIMFGAVVTLIATALLPRPVAELGEQERGRPAERRFVRPAEEREPAQAARR